MQLEDVAMVGLGFAIVKSVDFDSPSSCRHRGLFNASVSPRQQLTVGMPETATVGHGHFIDPGQQALHCLLRGNTA